MVPSKDTTLECVYVMQWSLSTQWPWRAKSPWSSMQWQINLFSKCLCPRPCSRCWALRRKRCGPCSPIAPSLCIFQQFLLLLLSSGKKTRKPQFYGQGIYGWISDKRKILNNKCTQLPLLLLSPKANTFPDFLPASSTTLMRNVPQWMKEGNYREE